MRGRSVKACIKRVRKCKIKHLYINMSKNASYKDSASLLFGTWSVTKEKISGKLRGKFSQIEQHVLHECVHVF